ncbi:hypothetical protein KKB55_09795, partial [Myxococcota bacterium]|nr:hypothetical protein [Myxococcota bacterium]MBU1898026.1 hypothetical protein [Myxococcota bacterium]
PPAPPAPPAWAQRPFWSDDPAVLVSNVKHLDEAAQIAHLDALLDLIGFQDGYPLNDQLVAMRALIARRLIASGDLQQWRRALAWLDAPRVPFASAWAAALAEAAPAKVARAILAEGGPPGAEAQTAWAIQAQPTAISWATWRDHPSPRLRRAALRAASPRLDDATLAAAAMDEALSEIALDAWAARRPAAPPPLPPSKQALLATHPRFAAQIDEADWRTWAAATDPTQRADVARGLARTGLHPALLDALQHDPHHRVRAAAMTPERAQALRVDPLQEPSWRVLAAAAAILNAPLSAWASQTTRALKPKPVERRWQTDSYFSLAPLAAPYRRGPRASQRATPRATRPFAGRLASALVVSGRHALPEAGYDLALEAGVNAFFWEPEYTQLTRWARALPDDLRRSLIWIGGTFSHEPQHVLRDLEQMRRALDIDEVAAFILFWVRDTARLEDEIIEALMEAQDQGRLSVFGFSTHDRGFALEGLAAGWPLVMVRHSAGHPSAEEAVLPTAAALGASVITFSNLCYGLMLDPREGQPPPYEAADCYRYALSQPGVTLTLTAPATIKALKENLNVLDQPTLDEAMMDTMRVWAAPIREETRRLLRQIRAQ